MNIIKTLRIDRSADFRLHQLDLQAAMSLVTTETHCGETPLLNVLKTGAIIFLKSNASGQNLRIRDGIVEGIGGQGDLAQFTVHCRGDRVVALQNVKRPEMWIRIKDGHTDGNGEGGEYCNLIADEKDGFLVFESQKYRGQHIGVLPDGSGKPPTATGTGGHARFYPSIFQERPEVVFPDRTPLMFNFAHGNVVVLTSKASGKTLRIRDGHVEGTGGKGNLAQFVVHVRGKSQVSLQNINDPTLYLRISDSHQLDVGKGGKFTVFGISEVDGFVVLESVVHHGSHVGILPNGQAKPANQTGTGDHARFFPEVVGENPENIRAGDSVLQRTLTHGNHIVLFSKASYKTLRIHTDGRLDGSGGEGDLATFIVHVIKPGVVALQNLHDQGRYLRASEEELGFSGGAHVNQHLRVKEVDGHLAFEAVTTPGHHVGVLDDGSVKSPHHTGVGKHGQFYPKVKKNSPSMTFLAGRGRLQQRFIHGSTVILESHASRKSLRNHGNGNIDGTGGSGNLAQWRVWVRGPGVVALQSVAHPNEFLAIRDSKLTTGNGGRFTSLLVKEVDGFVALESQLHDGHHVGIKPDGSAKPPGNTGTGPHGRFTPRLV